MSGFSVAQLVELLGIEEYKKNNFAFEGKLCRIIDVEINSNLRKFLAEFKDEEITFEFWRCNFSSDINLTNLEILSELIFTDCTFKKPFTARRTIFKNKIRFLNCTFCENFDCGSLEETTFAQDISFANSIFKQQANFCKAIFKSECEFKASVFEKRTDFSGAIFRGKVDFSISRFMSETKFIKTKFLIKVSDSESYENNFLGAYFEKRTDFSGAIFRGKVDFSISRFMSEARFIGTKFLAKTLDGEKYENNFQETHFEGKASFDFAIFRGKVDFSISRFMSEARFIGTKFLAKTLDGEKYENNFQETHFLGGVVFDNNNFNGRINFFVSYSKNSRFRGIDFSQLQINFVEAVFEGMKMLYCYFPATISFDKCIFRNTLFQNKGFDKKMFPNVRFEDCVFKETNTFGENIFIDKPLFKNCTFEGQFNIKHCFLHYEFESLEISSQIKPDEQTNKMITWRETFRRLKGNRLTYHNLIDASELRTQELYARELELKSKTPSLFSKEWLEKWQLCLYRLTSDHHTDLLKIIGWVLSVIAGFGVLLFACRYGLRFDSFVNHHKNFFLIQFLAPTLSEWITQTKAMGLAYLCFACGFVFGRLRWIMSLAIVLAIITIQPKYILGIGGLIGGEVQKYGMFENLLFVFYSLILGLLLFSLQKTARKNSIVPS